MAAMISLVPLHDGGGTKIYLNPAEISTLREPSAAAVKAEHFPSGTHCLVVTTNGKVVPVQETCDQVQALVSGR